ncbi:MAG: fasciclin domain-containing protein [Luteibaculaceae bacterium]
MQTMIRKFGFALAFGGMLVFSSSCSNDDDDDLPPAGPPAPTATIAELATATADLSILVEALTRTDLVGAVSDPNANLTVFAPTNEAFGNLLSDLGLADLDALEAALTTNGLRNVLLYHVLGIRATANQVQTGYFSTLATNSAEFNLSLFASAGSGVTVNGVSNVTTADILAVNGVVHIVDAVITPLNIVELASLNPDFSLLVAALVASANNPIDILSGDDNFTVFAPNNAGFAQLLQDLQLSSLEAVVGAIGTDGLFEVLAYHLVAGNVRASDVTPGNVATVQGETFSVAVNGGVVITDQRNRTANVIATDVTATNGTIHVINNVILPAE